MVVSSRVSSAVAALAIAAGACADGRDTLTAPSVSEGIPSASLNVKAMLASSSAIGDEGTRLLATIENGDQRAHLTAALERLARAMETADVFSARRALSDARDGMRFLQSDADRDALRLALDAADESLSITSTHGATR